MSRRLFTDEELSDKRINTPQFMASRFRSQGSRYEVHGRGMDSIGFTDIQIDNLPSGQPVVKLSGRAFEVADSMGITEIMLSISHSMSHAIAFAMAIGKGEKAVKLAKSETIKHRRSSVLLNTTFRKQF